MADNERKEGNAEEDKVNPGEETGLIDTAIKDEKITQNNMDKGSKKRKTAQKSRAVNKKSSVKRNNPPKESMKDKAVSKKSRSIRRSRYKSARRTYRKSVKYW